MRMDVWKPTVTLPYLAQHSNHKRHQAIVISHGRDLHVVPERRAVLAIVEERGVHLDAVFDAVAQPSDLDWVCVFSLQEATIASQDLCDRVACQLLKAWRGVDYGVISS